MVMEMAFKSLTVSIVIILSIVLTVSMLAEGDSYEPSFPIGSEESDWWINYPEQNVNASNPVEHPLWVLEALKEKPVLILDHSRDCKSCKIQIANLEKALDGLGDKVTYYDLLADSGDKEAYEVFAAYSPTGGAYYVPTTVFVTLAKGPDGEVSVAWHSEEDAMSEEEIRAYIQDAVYYYQDNASSWNE
jgi:hypothetical protein